MQKIYEISLDYKDFTNDHLFYIFTDEIVKLSHEGQLMPYHEYFINYNEKCCIFNDFLY